MFPARKFHRIQEFLPIKLHENTSLEYIEGLTWIPTSSLYPPGIGIHALALTNPSDFQNFEISFSWDTAIHPSQLALPSSSGDFRKRTWNISRSKHTLYEPIQEQADLPAEAAESPVHQAFTFSISAQFSNVVSTIQSMNTSAIGTIPKNCLYIRFANGGLKKYYVQQTTPSTNGVTLYHGSLKLYFKRIRPVSGPKFRFLYKQLRSFDQPNDWTAIPDTEFCLLSRKMPLDLHNKLFSILQDISD